MRLLKIPLYALLLILIVSSIANAQLTNCDAIGESPKDTIRIVSQKADTGSNSIVMLPISIVNDTGIATFQAYVEYDASILSPIIVGVDSLYDTLGNFTGLTQELYDYAVAARMLDTELKTDSLGFEYLDTINNVSVVSEVDFPGTGNMQRIRIVSTFTDFLSPEVIVPTGSGPVMYLKFQVAPTAVHGDLATVDFYAETIETRDTAFPFDIIRTDCLYSRYGDITGTIDRRMTTTLGAVQIDTTFTPGEIPTINSFSANPTTITTVGGSSTLSWSVTSADSIIINNGVGKFTSLNSSTSVTPSATTTYVLTAYNSNGTAQAFATVVVNTGGGGTGSVPVIQSIPGAPFTVNQGETVSFTVTATDADAGDIITLSAISIPANATFTQAVGSGSVSSSFSFSPDFTQTGTFVASFQASDNNGNTSSTTSVVINVIEIQNDRLFTTSAPGQRPVGGLKGKEAIYFPINLVTSQTVYGVQFDFHYDPVYFTVDSFVTTGRTADYVVYDNIGQTPGVIKIVTFGLANEPIVNVVDTTAILYAVMSIDSTAPVGDYPIWFEDGWESINPNPDFPSLELVVDSGVIQVDNPGDVNLDKRIDVADLVSVVASIIENYTLSERQFDVADVIIDAAVDVFDLVAIVNMIYGLPVSPAPPEIYADDKATIALAYNDIISGGNEMVVVNSELPVDIAAVELDIEYDPSTMALGKPSLAASTDNLSIRYRDDKGGKMKVLMHFTNPFGNQTIPSGPAELLQIPVIALDDVTAGDESQLKISSALMSTSSSAKVEVDGFDNPNPLPYTFALGQNYPNPFNPTTTIEFSIDVAQEVHLNIYNILGQQVKTLVNSHLEAGYHTVEWDATDNRGQRVATGVYLYRLEVDQNFETKKMLFLK